jgi:hypothetical protein
VREEGEGWKEARSESEDVDKVYQTESANHGGGDELLASGLFRELD